MLLSIEPDFEPIYALWDRLALGATAEIEPAAKVLLESVSRWINADRAGWVGTVRELRGPAAEQDSLLGWRFRSIVYHPVPSETELAEARHVLRKGLEEKRAGMSIVEVLRGAGSFRVHRFRDGFVDFERFEKTEPYDVYYRAMGVKDRMWVCVPIGDDAEVIFVFDRRVQTAPFSPDDARLAGYVMRGLTWFARQLLYSHGILVSREPLTATERVVAQLLLTRKSERQIADDLSQSHHTTHDHVKEIYRKFGVKSRSGFMAIWLTRL